MEKLTHEKIAELIGPDGSVLNAFNSIQKELQKAGAIDQTVFDIAPPFSGHGFPSQQMLEIRVPRNA